MSQPGRVQLLVYDLSRGMATAMSQSILGQQIEGIWHTGIQVFNTEYFFGGGIQAQPQGMFALQHQMPAVRTLDFGVTSRTKAELQTFLMSIQNRFNASTYDLLQNNCNNFSDTVSQFLVGQRIPSYIVDLPSIVLNTPGGQMLRPMIENMQNSVYSQQMRGPTGSSAYSIEASSLTQSLDPQSITPANIESKPLVSIDHTTVEALGNKIISLKTTEKDDTGLPLNKFAFSEEEQLIIKGIMLIVTASDRSSSDINSFCSEDSCRVLTKVMEKYPAAQMSSLFLMRLLVLQETIIFKTVHMCAVAMVDSVIAKLAAGQGAVNGFASVPSTVMALCTLANLLSHESGEALIFDRAGVAEAVLDIVLVGLSHSRVEVRQMSATVAFNFTLAFKEADNKGLNQLAANSTRRIICTVGQEAELNLLAVQLFCGVMEGIHSETDGSVRYRRLCVALKLVRIGGQALKDLGRDLGFHNDLNFLNSSSEVEMLVVGEMKRGFI